LSAYNSPFSLEGRLGRKPYFQWVGSIVAFRIIAAVTVVFRPDWIFLIKGGDFLIILIAILTGRRMKDFGVAPAWGWIAVALISFVLPIGGMILWPQPFNAADPLSIIPSGVGLLTTILLLVLIITVGARRGDVGPNRYGDPPDDAATATETTNS
jgi:uncharacterized membrane protein YhaH (DUF805 family)